MRRRIIIVLVILCMLFAGGGTRLHYIISSGDYLRAGSVRSTYTLKLNSGRGLIYDRNGKRLVEDEIKLVAAVRPNADNIDQLCRILPDQADQIRKMAESGKPFLVTLEQSIKTDIQDVTVFQVPCRYGRDGNEFFLPHIIGYTDGSGRGVTGIEAAYDELLNGQAVLSISYINDAYGRLIVGAAPEIVNNTDAKQGVQLTIDKQVQQITARAAKEKGLTSGAVLVLSVPDNEILASVSLPDFNPYNVAASLYQTGSPLLNKTLSPYSTGSVFKLVVAAAALDNGISADLTFNCTGEIAVGDVVFHCHRKEGHGLLNMSNAIAQSCNVYFIELAKKIGWEKLLDYAKRLGLGSKEQLASTIVAQSGTLPRVSTLKLPAGLANFAFGQGELTATPLQIACLVSCIAGGGVLYKPSLVEGIVQADGSLSEMTKAGGIQVITKSSAAKVADFMRNAMETGTGKSAMPSTGGAGGKTATAETGILVEGREINRAWFAGFYPSQNPRYAIVVMSEDGISGSETAGPVFKAICEGLARIQ